MKKAEKWVVVLGTILLLSGCGFGATSEAVPSEKPVSALPIPSKEETCNLSMASGSYGADLIRGNQNGAYFLWSEDNGDQVLYVDYKTKSLMAWTNQLNPSQDESNPGWIGDSFGGTRPYVTEEHVYVLKEGRLPIPRVGFPGSPCKLSQLSLDGTGRRTITLAPNQMILQNSGVAAEGEKLYLLVGTYDASGDLERCEVCYTDFAKEQLVAVAALDLPGRYALVGVYDQGLLLQKTTVPAEYETSSYREQRKHYQYNIQRFSLTDGTVTTGKVWKRGERSSCVYGEGGMYYIDRETGSLYWYDAQQDQEQLLFGNVVPDGYEKAALDLHGEDYGDHLLGYLYQPDGEMIPVGIDLHSGSCTPVTLSYAYNMGTMPVSIVAQTADQFLVEIEQVERTFPMVDENGKVHDSVQAISRYALMEKADYWASQPNYEKIADYYFDSRK